MVTRRMVITSVASASTITLSGCTTNSSEKLGTVHATGYGQHEHDSLVEFIIIRKHRPVINDEIVAEAPNHNEEYHGGGIIRAFCKKQAYRQLDKSDYEVFKIWNEFANLILNVESAWEYIDEAITSFLSLNTLDNGIIGMIWEYIEEISDYTGKTIELLREQSSTFDLISYSINEIVEQMKNLPDAADRHLHDANAFSMDAREAEAIFSRLFEGEPIDWSSDFGDLRPSFHVMPLYQTINDIESEVSRIVGQIESLPSSLGIPPELAPLKFEAFVEAISRSHMKIDQFVGLYKDLVQKIQLLFREFNNQREALRTENSNLIG